MSAEAIRYPGGVEAEVSALRQALDGENRRARKAEERVLELADLAEQLRRRLKERQRHDDEMTVRAHRAEKRCQQLQAVITSARPGPVKYRVERR